LSVVIYITALTIGLAAGSFLNVVVYRLPRGKSIVKPRSSCPQCGKNVSRGIGHCIDSHTGAAKDLEEIVPVVIAAPDCCNFLT